MAKNVRIPWMVDKQGNQELPHYLHAEVANEDEDTGWMTYGFGEFWPVGAESPYPGYRDTPRTHALRWQEQGDLRGTLTVEQVGRGRSSATLIVRLMQADGRQITGCLDVGWAPALLEVARDGSADVTIAPRKRGKNYLFELIETRPRA